MSESSSNAETFKQLNKDIIEQFRDNGGQVGGQFENANLLLLTTTGAKSGERRVSPLAYFDVDGRVIIVGSFAGSPNNPAWVHNLRADPQAHIEIGPDAYDVTARELAEAERDELFAKVTAAAPVFNDYQSKTSRVIPLFELQRG